MATTVTARNTHIATRIQRFMCSSSAIRQTVTMIPTCSDANAAIVCTAWVANGS